jgi:hypothetical protein
VVDIYARNTYKFESRNLTSQIIYHEFYKLTEIIKLLTEFSGKKKSNGQQPTDPGRYTLAGPPYAASTRDRRRVLEDVCNDVDELDGDGGARQRHQRGRRGSPREGLETTQTSRRSVRLHGLDVDEQSRAQVTAQTPPWLAELRTNATMSDPTSAPGQGWGLG